MGILISIDDAPAERLSSIPFEEEKLLQEDILKHPDCIPLHEFKEGIRLSVLCREFPTSVGPIDAIAADQDGDLYLIEAKLAKNADKRRVIAQALDYGAAMQMDHPDAASLRAAMEAEVPKHRGGGLREVLEGDLAIPAEAVDDLLAQVHANLATGRLRFVIVMDSLDERLKNLISFVNRSSGFSVLGIELEVYRRGEIRVMIPNLFGAEAARAPTVRATGRNRSARSLQEFRSFAAEQLRGAELKAVERMLEWAEGAADEIRMGTGAVASVNPRVARVAKMSIFTLTAGGQLTFNFDYLKNSSTGRERLAVLIERLNEIGLQFRGRSFTADLKHPTLAPVEWASQIDELIPALQAAVSVASDEQSSG